MNTNTSKGMAWRGRRLTLIKRGKYQDINNITRNITGKGATDVPPNRFANKGKLVIGKVSTINAHAAFTNPW